MMAGALMAVVLVSLVVGAVVGAGVFARTNQRPKSVKSKWRLQVDAGEVLVRTGRDQEAYSWEVAERWRFDPTDVDSRAEALAKAEDYLAGLRDAEQRAWEINGR